MLPLPRLYAILGSSCLTDLNALVSCAQELAGAGVTLLQYRDKSSNARRMLDNARALRRALGGAVTLIMNDRADLCLAAEYDGVHLGQDDLSPNAARRIIGNERWMGLSTHNAEQVRIAGASSAD
jgi:thiamine-phosphate pyrophosphorylase